jgi:uncharacterized protein YcnI
MLRRLVAPTALALAAIALLAPAAWAHVDLEPGEALAGSTTTLTFSFHHGKDGTATTALVVQVPEGTTFVEAPAVEGFSSVVDEAERTVTWSGGSVPDGTEARFPLVVELPSTPGVALFPTLQETEAGQLAWIGEDEGEGEDESPAPRLTLLPDPDATSSTTTSEPTTTTTERELAGTTLEAQQRDDGDTSAAPWVIGSGLAALVVIGAGGMLLKRRMG